MRSQSEHSESEKIKCNHCRCFTSLCDQNHLVECCSREKRHVGVRSWQNARERHDWRVARTASRCARAVPYIPASAPLPSSYHSTHQHNMTPRTPTSDSTPARSPVMEHAYPLAPSPYYEAANMFSQPNAERVGSSPPPPHQLWGEEYDSATSDHNTSTHTVSPRDTELSEERKAELYESIVAFIAQDAELRLWAIGKPVPPYAAIQRLMYCNTTQTAKEAYEVAEKLRMQYQTFSNKLSPAGQVTRTSEWPDSSRDSQWLANFTDGWIDATWLVIWHDELVVAARQDLANLLKRIGPFRTHDTSAYGGTISPAMMSSSSSNASLASPTSACSQVPPWHNYACSSTSQASSSLSSSKGKATKRKANDDPSQQPRKKQSKPQLTSERWEPAVRGPRFYPPDPAEGLPGMLTLFEGDNIKLPMPTKAVRGRMLQRWDIHEQLGTGKYQDETSVEADGVDAFTPAPTPMPVPGPALPFSFVHMPTHASASGSRSPTRSSVAEPSQAQSPPSAPQAAPLSAVLDSEADAAARHAAGAVPSTPAPPRVQERTVTHKYSTRSKVKISRA